MLALFPRSRVFRSGRIFDSTLGFPGEGPDRSWTILSSNVGSFIKDNTWKGWEDNVICLQETRIGRNNFRNAIKSAAAFGRNLILGDLLPGLFRSDGSGSTSHGGVAMIAPSQLSVPFQKSDDCSGLFERVFHSKRVQATWCQVLPSLKILVFNFYGKSGASASHDILQFNDEILRDIFQIASRFGIFRSLWLVTFNLHHSNTLRLRLPCILLIGLILSPTILKMGPLIDPSRIAGIAISLLSGNIAHPLMVFS